MAKFSKTIAAMVAKHPSLEDYYADSDGHWVHLKPGLMVKPHSFLDARGNRWFTETTAIHEWTVADCISHIRDLEVVKVPDSLKKWSAYGLTHTEEKIQ